MTRFALFSFLIAVLACGDDDVVTDDPAEDASMSDAGGDGGGSSDAGSDTDAGSEIEDGGPTADAAGAETDASTPMDDLGASPCAGLTIGTPCRERCPMGFECVDGACLPGAMRPGCGGFAGAMCTTRAFPNCATYSGSDYGPCLSEEEIVCACSALTDRFDCPEAR